MELHRRHTLRGNGLRSGRVANKLVVACEHTPTARTLERKGSSFVSLRAVFVHTPLRVVFRSLQFHFCRDDDRQGWKDPEGGV